MKKFLSTFLIIFFASVANAQIPNPGFENWSSTGTISNPDGWSTSNNSGVSPVTQGKPGDPGNSYIKLITQTYFGVPVPGYAVSGKINSSFKPVSGFPYSSRPGALTGNWQYMAGSLTDSGFILIGFSKWNSTTNHRDTVGYALHYLKDMVMSWTSFSIPISWIKSTENPDTAVIVLSSSNGNIASSSANSYLFVDNLAFKTASAIEGVEDFIPGLSVYPNPASNILNVFFNSKGLQTWKIELMDINGRLILQHHTGSLSGDYNYSLETSSLAKGIYTLKISGERSIAIKKIVLE